MAYPIITLIFAAIVAFLAFQGSTLETGMSESTPPMVEQDSADEAEPADEAAEEEAE